MGFVSSAADPGQVSASRPMVKGLFVASCVLSIVSWYTTQQGMALYLAPWFAFLASLGVQTALVLVAWLIGFTKARRGLLVSVYAITAVVSIAFSYVSLYTWFSVKERPAQVQRALYDEIGASAGKTEQLLAGAIAEGQKHVLALDEMTEAEKSHGWISRAQDSDPYLAGVREAVAREAQTYDNGYKEGSGGGLRYTAFDRYAKMSRQSLERMQAASRSLATFRAQLKPLDPSEQQIRKYREVYDAIPWNEVDQTLHAGRLDKPGIPNYAEHVDRSASGQEDLLLAFQELVTAPTGRHVFALLLATFIDVIVFLVAFASGPFFFGSPEQRWRRAAAVLDDADEMTFVRDFLRKLEPDGRGMARVEVARMTPGESQFCLALAGKGGAELMDAGEGAHYVLDAAVHEQLLDSLAGRRLPLPTGTRAAAEV